MLNKNYSDETKKLKAFIDEYEDQTDDSKSFEKQGTPAITARGEASKKERKQGTNLEIRVNGKM